MKKTTKLIIFSCALIFVGGLMMVIGLMNGARTTVYWDTQKHRFVIKDEEQMYLVQEKMPLGAFDSIYIDAEKECVRLIPSDGWYVEYRVMADNADPLTVENGRLNFSDSTGRFFIMALNFFSKEQEEYINIYYPADAEFESIDIELDMGNLDIEGLRAKSAGLNLDMGNLDIRDCEIGQLDAELNMGNMNAANVFFDMLDAEIDMGSVELTLNGKNKNGRAIAYGFDIETDMGDIEVNGAEQGDKYKVPGDVLLKISCDMGDVLINLD